MPGLVPIPTSDMMRSRRNIDENPEKCEHEEWINRKRTFSVDVCQPPAWVGEQ